ncbi:MAG TPA: VWA domain-containing protein [Thermoanaerobaculia bacterium]|nr:VWA domain-containing protein [Thermoanaerobaculia bacterium]
MRPLPPSCPRPAHRAAPLRLAPPAALVALLAAPALIAAQESVDVPGVFSEVLDIRVVEVEVVVTDDTGRRVPGLRRDDFRITVDGVPRAIDFFDEIRDGDALSTEPPDAAGAELDPPGPERGSAARSTSYLIFIDDSFTHARDRNLVLERLARDLERLAPGDRMAVVAFDGRELTLLTAWTSSQRVLAGALRDARVRPSAGGRRARERRLVEATQAGATGRRLSGMQHRYARLLGTQVERAVMAAVASLRSFSSPPGRKVMVILAGGWPLSPAELAASGGILDEAIEDAYASGVLGYESLYGPLVDTANLLGYTLYPVDVSGKAGRIDPETPLGLLGGGGDRSFVGPEGNFHAGMRFLAEKTGGRAVVNDQREAALAAVAADTRSYYSLAFRLDRAADDARHAIEVEVLRPGLEARAREGFVDLSRRTEMTMMTASALLFGNPASPLAAQLRFGRPERAGRGRVRLRVEVGFPLDGIALLPSGGGWHGEVSVRLVAMDDEGARIEPLLAAAPIALAP